MFNLNERFYVDNDSVYLGENLNLKEIDIPLFYYKDDMYINDYFKKHYCIVEESTIKLSIESLRKKINNLDKSLFDEGRITLYIMKPAITVKTSEGEIEITPLDEIALTINCGKGYTLHVNRINKNRNPNFKSRWFKTKEQLKRYVGKTYLSSTIEYMFPYIL